VIDVSPGQMETIKDILRRIAPSLGVRAFGSRVTGMAKPHSDLDLAVVDKLGIGRERLDLLKEEFEESDLPFRVDVMDWNALSESLRKMIESSHEVIQREPEHGQ
jgi:predicted nucleotidyltransferase